MIAICQHLRAPLWRLRLFLVFGFVVSLATISMASGLKDDEHAMFLPDIAYQQADGKMVAHVQAWVYEKEKRRGLTSALALFLGIDMSSLTEKERQQFYARTQLFRVDSERGKQLHLKAPDGQKYVMVKTGSNGRAEGLFPIVVRNPDQSGRIAFTLESTSPNRMPEALAYFAPMHGLSVISDIDDTIKHSAVGKTRQLLINTFLEDFVPVEGMAAMYQQIGAQDNVAFHYVSSSPIQLYPVLHEFMAAAGFPEGSMHLREATRWTDMIPVPKSSITHKTKAIERILKAYPQRQFILIGDSGEDDAQIYASFMRKYPHQIRQILIRDVTPQRKTEDYVSIFKGLDSKRWLVSGDITAMKRALEIAE